MIFVETKMAGAYRVEPQQLEDGRGFFARTWCQKEFEAQGLNGRLVQCSISFSKRSGTLRGMHYQAEPHREAKLVRCIRGAIWDVIIDLRVTSATYLDHLSVTLSAENRTALYVPEGFAHGFQTLTDDTEVFYQMSEHYAPQSVRGVRWNDPAFAIRWPGSLPIINERDNTYPDYLPERPQEQPDLHETASS